MDGAEQDAKTRSTIYKLYEASKEPKDKKLYVTVTILGGKIEFAKNVKKAKDFVLQAFLDACRKKLKEPIDLFGWSRGAIEVITLAKQLKEATGGKKQQFPLTIRFMGLIDPVDTQVKLVSTTTVPDIVEVVWLGQKDGTVKPERLIFASAKIDYENKALTDVTEKKYAVNHNDSGFDMKLAQDLWTAATNAKVPLNALPKK